MFFNNHEPPHLHARYQAFSARICIADGAVIADYGRLARAKIGQEFEEFLTPMIEKGKKQKATLTAE